MIYSVHANPYLTKIDVYSEPISNNIINIESHPFC